MPIKLYNTLTRKKETFKPIKAGKVGLYSCGPTVYNYAHIGNLRTYIFNDILKRILLYNGYDVKHVMNITDVGHLTSDEDEGEDKVEMEAKKEHKTAIEIAKFYSRAFQSDIEQLNILPPSIWCKATEHIAEQITLIQQLEKKGYTYKTADGIYFDTSKFKNYGKFAKLKIKQLKAGARIKIGEKKSKTDFALWKFSFPEQKRQMEWQSPWGKGFPGWHLECSAMSMRYLGEHFDIHTGGIDHIPVHHENEIAQSEVATGKKFVNYWIHANFLVMSDEGKMSKSAGEFLRLQTLIEKNYSPLDYRYFCLTAHYRSELLFSWQNLDAAKAAFSNMKNKVLEVKQNLEVTGTRTEKIKKKKEEFKKIINDDLNMPAALAFFWNILKNEELKNNEKYALMLNFDHIFGLQLDKVKKEEIEIPEKIKQLAEKREQARKSKDFKLADELREKIKKQGFWIDDTEQGYEIKKI
ncbi:cysteine--tRNA ligase [Candidatus Pacearchaeota archaeon]|nr:cysteine--tRNA ligase [Candidatus Pacearchaeota archaeon]